MRRGVKEAWSHRDMRGKADLRAPAPAPTPAAAAARTLVNSGCDAKARRYSSHHDKSSIEDASRSLDGCQGSN